jgi:carbamoyltransferase
LISDMRIIGIGGLPGAEAFRRLCWPKLDEREYSVGLGADAAAALVVDGELIASAKEESFIRSPHTSEFPTNAIKYCLSTNNLLPDEIDVLVHCFDYSDYEELYLIGKKSALLYRNVLSREALLKEVGRRLPALPAARVRQISNHLAHAAGAYLTSGWEDCLVAVIDGLGDGQSATAYRASPRGLVEIKEISAYDSIAVFYSLISVYLGFNWQGDEWQLMDLAAQGDPGRFRPFFEQAVQLRPDGTIMIWPLRLNKRSGERDNYLATRRCLFEYLGPKRLPQGEIEQRHKDIVAGLQECVNRVVLHICKHLAKTTGHPRIALTGQLALNCSANSVLLQSGMFEEVYIPTAAGDDGAAIGAALYVAWQERKAISRRMPATKGHHNYPPSELRPVFGQFARQIQVRRFASLEEKSAKIAALIVDKKIVARDEGGAAFGSTVFGRRSILTDPSDPGMRKRLGTLLNEATRNRAVAAAVTVEEAGRWFNLPKGTELTGTVLTVPVKPPFAEDLAAVIQQDGTARIQAIDRHDHPELHRILVEVGRLTGREVVLTTSFNVAEQPIVDSAREALETFLLTGIDCLILDNSLILKNGINHRRLGEEPGAGVVSAHELNHESAKANSLAE